MVLTQDNLQYEGLLYPMMVIAAVAAIVFSLLGMASMSGWMPSALAAGGVQTQLSLPSQSADTSAEARAPFGCAECGVIETLRDIDARAVPASPL